MHMCSAGKVAKLGTSVTILALMLSYSCFRVSHRLLKVAKPPLFVTFKHCGRSIFFLELLWSNCNI